MREEIFNLTRKEYQVLEYLDTNPIKYDTDPVKVDIFGNNVTEYRSYAPWGHFELKSEYTTEEKYLENYGNPFAMVNHTRRIMCITKEGDKITFKMFWYNRRRRIQSKWFKTNTQCKFITFNHKTNALYLGSIDNYHLKRKCRKRISRALFNTDPINRMREWVRNSFSSDEKKTIDVSTIVNQVVSLFVNSIPGTEKYPELLPEQKIYRRYLDAQGIKYPNNWFELIGAWPQPKKKDLVKCGYKYVDALMRVHNLKGDKIKKSLHNVSSFADSSHFKLTCEIFGEKFILNQPDEIINLFLSAWGLTNINKNSISNIQSKSEKLNFFEIYKLYYKKLINYHTFNDHIRFYNFLRNVEPVKWKSRTHDEFTQEHYEWSEKYSHYTNGDFTRVYNPKFVEFINEVILTKDGPYFPEVLLTSKRYNNESMFQSNCVKSYIKRVDSLLISLRRGEGDTEERASIEYQIIPLVWPDKIEFNLNRVQTLGKYNHRLDSSWDDAIFKLDERISVMVYEKTFDTLQIEGEFGGRKVFSDYTIKEYDRTGYKYLTNDSRDKGVYLVWENDSIMKLNSYNLNVVPVQNWDDDDEFPL
jgi:hypothetical protein